MWSGEISCLTCKFLKSLIETKYPTMVENACGCTLHKVILPLSKAKGVLLCRDGRHWNSQATLSERWPAGYKSMKDRVLYTYPNDYEGTLTEFCEISSLPQMPESP